MKILSIDTSTEVCSAAILIGDKVNYKYEKVARQHTKLILPMINQLLSEAQITLSNLDCLAFTSGPGSFTGVRIGASVIQGLSYAKDLPVVSVSTLATLAQGAYRTFDVNYILPVLDARMDQIYFGAYKINEEKIAVPLCDDSVIDTKNILLPNFGNFEFVGVGSGWEKYFDVLKKNLKSSLIKAEHSFYPNAIDIIPLAINKFKKGEVLFCDKALPVYLTAISYKEQ